MRTVNINWSAIPLAIVYMHPYFIALLPQKIEIRAFNTGIFIQEIELNNSNIIIAKDVLFLSYEDNLYTILPIDFDNQVIFFFFFIFYLNFFLLILLINTNF